MIGLPVEINRGTVGGNAGRYFDRPTFFSRQRQSDLMLVMQHFDQNIIILKVCLRIVKIESTALDSVQNQSSLITENLSGSDDISVFLQEHCSQRPVGFFWMWKHVNKVRFTLARLTFCCVTIIQFYEALLQTYNV